MGLEPTRAKRSQEPESCSSANSDTSAYVSFNSQNVFYMVIYKKSSESLKSFEEGMLKENVQFIILINRRNVEDTETKEKSLCMML